MITRRQAMSINPSSGLLTARDAGRVYAFRGLTLPAGASRECRAGYAEAEREMMAPTTKNEYAALRATLAALDKAREYHNRRSSLNVGVISGGVDMTESGKSIERLVALAEGIVSREIARGCRLAHLRSIVREYGSSRSINDTISDEEIRREATRR